MGEKDEMLGCIEEAVARSKERDMPRALTIGEAREAMRLWGEREYERGKKEGARNPSLDWALNSGDGSYRP